MDGVSQKRLFVAALITFCLGEFMTQDANAIVSQTGAGMTMLHVGTPGCIPITFPSGKTVTIETKAPPPVYDTTGDHRLCYSFTAKARQTATVKLLSWDNATFAIDDVYDHTGDVYAFKTEATTYTMRMGAQGGYEAVPIKFSVTLN